MHMWECLPEDILDEILNQVVMLSDFIRFGGVCKTWYVVFIRQKRHRMERCNNEVPFLFVPVSCMYIDLPGKSDPSSKLNTNRFLPLQNQLLERFKKKCRNLVSPVETQLPDQLFNMCETKCYDSMSPLSPSGHSLTSVLSASYGWLATVTVLREERGIAITLNNPMTGNTISLPTIHDSPLSPISKVVMSCNPSIYPDKCVVACSAYTRIRVIRLGGIKWSIFSQISQKEMVSILFHKGRLYALDKDRNLFAIDFNWEPNSDKCDFQSCHIVEDSNCEHFRLLYLVETLTGELLMIRRLELYPFPGLMVYKLVITHDDGNEKMKGHWVQTHSLGNGDEVLFLTRDGNAICSRCRDLQPDSVYFGEYYYCLEKTGYYIMRVFALKNEEQADKYIELDVTLRKRFGNWDDMLPFWINPTLQ